MGEIDINECRSGMVELSFNHDGRIHSDQIGRYVLLLRIDHQMLGIVPGGLLIDVIEHAGGQGGNFTVLVCAGLKGRIQDDQRFRVRRHPDRIRHKTDIFHFRNHLVQGLGGIGGSQDDVVERASVFAQILFAGLRCLIEDALRVCDRVNRRHGRGEDLAGRFIFEKRFEHVRQTGCGAGSRGNDLVFLIVKGGVVDPVDERHCGVGYGQGLVFDLECRRIDHHLCPAGEMPLQGAAFFVRRQGGVLKFARAFHHHIHAVVPPADLGRVSRLPQDGHGDAVDEERAFFFIDNPDHPFRLDAVQEPVDGSVGRILFDQLRDGGKSFPDASSHIDEDLLKIFSSDMVPQGKLAYPPEAVDAENRSPVFKNLDFPHTHTSFLLRETIANVPLRKP